MHFFPYWLEYFYKDINNEVHEIQTSLEGYLHRAKHYYILEVDGVPVSMATINKTLQSVFGVAGVYTPPYFRKKGYATACVAELCRQQMKKGFTKAVLYTDLANPTSNKIYMEIGFTAIADSLEISFQTTRP